MAARGLLVSAVVKEVAKLGSTIWEEIGLVWGFEKNLKEMESTFSTIEAVLEDAEKRSVGDRALRNWLEKLKDAANDIDELFNELQIEVEYNSNLGKCKKVCRFFSCSNTIVSRSVMARRMMVIKERLDKIVTERSQFHLKESSVSDRLVAEIEKRETFSEIDESAVYGRDEDRDKIVRLLLETDGEEDITVISIVGLKGIGKTTLAKLAFNDARVKCAHFDLRIWVYVSMDFDLKRVATSMICATGESCSLENLEVMRSCIENLVEGKRFLIVLDDVSIEDVDGWENLMLLLRGGRRGSKIIVTAGSESVALLTGTVASHNLKGLSEEDCWALFKRRAFEVGGEERNPNLASIGRQIAKKCEGVPLTANVLGTMLRLKRGEETWSAIRDSKIWELENLESLQSGMLPI